MMDPIQSAAAKRLMEGVKLGQKCSEHEVDHYFQWAHSNKEIILHSVILNPCENCRGRTNFTAKTLLQ